MMKRILTRQSPYLVAEIGINHNGSIDLAKEMIVQAAKNGADAVKFQNYKTEDFIIDKSLSFSGWSQGKKTEFNQYELFKSCELSDTQVFDLFKFSQSLNIDFHSTPTSHQGVDLLKNIGVNVLKNGSDFLTDKSLIQYMGESGLTTVISTGMATEAEIENAIQVFHKTGNEKLIVLHCTSAYPTADKEVNLRKMLSLKEKFNVSVGFSDHTRDNYAACLATAMGACWIEKHFTLDKKLSGPDHHFSVTPEELQKLRADIDRAACMLGDSVIKPTATEVNNRLQFQLSLIAKENLKPGTVLNKEHLTTARPGGGIEPSRIKEILGREVANQIAKGQQISEGYLKGANHDGQL